MTQTHPGRAPLASAAVTSGPPVGGARYLNRHLSWLDFNARVLEQADDRQLPVLERAKFLAIFSSNLDDFFQVRVGGLKEQQAAGARTQSPDGMSVADQLRRIRERIEVLVRRQEEIFRGHVSADLEASGIRFSAWSELDDDDRAHLDNVFEERMFPVLTPLAVDPAHPFPFISNLSLNLAVVVIDPVMRMRRIARVKVPPVLPRFVVMPDGERFVPLEQVIAAHLGRLFPGMDIVSHHVFRVTRNADFAVQEDEGEDLISAVETILRRRRRSPRVVRVEVERTMSDEVRSLLLRELEITAADVYVCDGPLDLGGLWTLYRIDRPDLRDEPWLPVTPPRLAALGASAGSEATARSAVPGDVQHEDADVFAAIRDGDLLLHHPYDSFDTTVEAFIRQAARDPDVLAIKQTLYRTSGEESAIVHALVDAAESGKQVVALVELTARFDEAKNIAWARALEEAGVHVVYGMVGLKTHAKTTLVVRRENGGVRRYCHVGTGNYNSETARLYEDIGLLTCDPAVGADLSDLFNYLTGYSRQRRYRRLLVAPVTLRPGLLDLVSVERERGSAGRIVIKVNNLADPEIIEALYDASNAGVDIDLIVRSACALRPGVPGMSENIRVRSIVGTYLEHSRIFAFGRGGDAGLYIGSADLMGRNLDGRVEAVIPVSDPVLRGRLQEVLEVELSDDVLASALAADGTWSRVPTVRGVNAHRRLRELAVSRLTGGA